MSDEGIRVTKNLLIQELIYTPCAKTVINVKTKDIITRKSIDDLVFHQIAGGRTLQKYLFGEEIVIQKTTYRYIRGKRYSEQIPVGTFKSYDAIAKNLSLVLPVTGKEVKKLLVPFLEKGSERIYLQPLCGIYNLPPMTNPDLSFNRWRFRNIWKASGSVVRDHFQFINKLLKKRESPWRVQTVGLNVGAEEYGDVVAKLSKRIEELEKGKS